MTLSFSRGKQLPYVDDKRAVGRKIVTKHVPMLFADSLKKPLRRVSGQLHVHADEEDMEESEQARLAAKKVTEERSQPRASSTLLSPRRHSNSLRLRGSARRSLSPLALSTLRRDGVTTSAQPGAHSVQALLDSLKTYTLSFPSTIMRRLPTTGDDEEQEPESFSGASRSLSDTEEPVEKGEGNKAMQHRTQRIEIFIFLWVLSVVGLAATEAVTLVMYQILHPGDFLCDENPSPPAYPARPNVVAFAVIALLMTVHGMQAAARWSRLLARANVFPRWMQNSLLGTGARRMTTMDFVQLLGLTCTVVLTGVILEKSLFFCSTPHLESDNVGWHRLHVAVHTIRALIGLHSCVLLRGKVRVLMQKTVSGNKRRFMDKEFDLDLTHIADRLVAMALPCVAGAAYRNDIRDTCRFFTSRHYGAFKVFNLCEGFEESGNGNYDTTLFYNQVVKVPQRDHNICSLQTLVNTIKQATAFLNLDNSNVVAFHCRGGKGRTGSFCASLLLWCGFSRTAAHALATFAHRRTDLSILSLQGTAMQGVASPSQIRYVHYVEAVRYLDFDFVAPRMILINRIEIEGVPLAKQGGAFLTFVVETASGIVYDYAKSFGLRRCQTPDEEFAFHIGNLPVTGDVAIRFFAFNTEDPKVVIGCTPRLTPGGRGMEYTPSMSCDVVASGRQIFFVQFHTSFHRDSLLHFSRPEIDGAYNAKTSHFAPHFSLSVEVTDLPLLIANKAAARAEQELSLLIQTDERSRAFFANAVNKSVIRRSNGIRQSSLKLARDMLRASSIGVSSFDKPPDQGLQKRGAFERAASRDARCFAGSTHAGAAHGFQRADSDNDIVARTETCRGSLQRAVTVDTIIRPRRKSMCVSELRCANPVSRGESVSTAASRAASTVFVDSSDPLVQKWDSEVQTVPGKAWVSTDLRPESVTSALADGDDGFMGRSTMWSGRRLLQLHTPHLFERLMTQVGAEELSFSKGEAVRDGDNQGDARCLILVTSGNIAVYPHSRAEWAEMPYYNPGAQRGTLLRGAGEFCCIGEFFLGTGHEDKTSTSHVLAASDKVKCLILRLEDNQMQPPLFGHLMPHSDVNQLYEALARR